MPNTFLVFDETGAGMLNDAQYSANVQRQNGLPPGKANPALHNKVLRQVSIMASAIGRFIDAAVFNASDQDAATLQENFTNAIKATGQQTGDFLYSLALARSGYVLADGRTIGNAGSNGSSRANADTQALFILIWTVIPDMPLFNSSGAVIARGSSAANDFTNNRAIQVPDLRGRVFAGMDNMGGNTAGRLVATSSVGTFNGNTMGATGGQNVHTQTQNELVNHSHGINQTFSTVFSPGTGRQGVQAGGSGSPITIDATGGGQPFNVVQPTFCGNIFLKL